MIGADGRRPPRLLPILYFAVAHLCLAAGLGTLAFSPAAGTGFFRQPLTLTATHLLTLGWIGGSILGSLYIVGPLALRTPMPARRTDVAGFVLFVIGVTGVVGHFAVDRYSGLAWSGSAVLLGFVPAGARFLRGVWRAPVEPAVRTHLALAFINLSLAAGLGILLAADRAAPFLPSRPGLSGLYAHVHLAAIGWVAMLVIGVGDRLLPMLLPAAMPRGRALYASAVLLQAGVIGLAIAFVAAPSWTFFPALVAAAGFLSFFIRVGWMLRHPRRPPAALRRPDFGVLHVLQAIVCAALCAVIGLALTVVPASSASLAAAGLYGALGLVGFLSQMVIGVEARLLPLYAVSRARPDEAGCRPALDPHALASRPLQAAAFCGWASGVPLLAAGFGLQNPIALGAGAWVLFLAALLGGVNALRILRQVSPPERGMPFLRGVDPAAPEP